MDVEVIENSWFYMRARVRDQLNPIKLYFTNKDEVNYTAAQKKNKKIIDFKMYISTICKEPDEKDNIKSWS